ncbi:MAG: N-acetyltransferase family protein [Verrucomicrobia bacterium]|nr:N-acetyltransferase family protein [Verrucomicrobiota bacterium]
MPTSFLIRPATAADLPSISRIYNDAVLNTTATYDYEPEPISRRAKWFEEHQRDRMPVLVAVDGREEILGWASLSPFHNRPGFQFTAENSLYVDAAHRGKGLGGALLRDLLPLGCSRGLKVVVAGIDGSNEVSIRLHEKQGFTVAGRLKRAGYKFGRWLDLVYMQKFL